MNGGDKKKEQSIKEVTKLRQRVKRLEETLDNVEKKRTDDITKANKQLQKELTDRKKYEQELKQSEKRFQNLVETANVGIISAESNVITQVNKKAEEIYGYSREELIGQSPKILVPEQIEQIFVNLQVNTTDAIEEQKEKGIIEITVEEGDDCTRIKFANNGPSIPEDKVDDLFKSFYTTTEVGKGTGLGLAICQNIAENHDGSLTVKNRLQGGAEFTIELPLCRDTL